MADSLLVEALGSQEQPEETGPAAARPVFQAARDPWSSFFQLKGSKQYWPRKTRSLYGGRLVLAPQNLSLKPFVSNYTVGRQ